MALTPEQLKGLQAAEARKNAGTATSTDLQNLDYAQQNLGYGGNQQGQPQGAVGTDKSSFLVGIGVTPEGGDAEQEAQMWQALSGGNIQENPYIPFLQPREFTDQESGKKFIRIPKNQTMMDLADFFEGARKQRTTEVGNLGDQFIKWQNNQVNQALDTATTQYQLNKPYSSGGGGRGSDLLSPTEAKLFNVPYGTTEAEVYGTVPGSTQPTKSFDEFMKEMRTTGTNQYGGGYSIDPRAAYQSYQEAQQAIDANPEVFDQIVNDPEAQAFSHLLKPKSYNMADQISSAILQSIEGIN